MTAPYILLTATLLALLVAVFGGFVGTANTEISGADSRYNMQTMAVATAGQVAGSSSLSVGGGGIDLAGDAAVVAPQNPSAGQLAQSNVQTDDKQASIYTVRDGDTLQGIAELFDVSVNTIVWANDLEGGTIHPGDTLVILPVSGVRHEVKEGETISELAERFGVSAEKIREYNELESAEKLAVGAILDIPGGEMPEGTQSTQDAGAADQSSRATTNRSVASGYFIHPLPSGRRSQGLHGYNAVDLAAPTGSSIRAAASGRVTKSVGAGWNGGYGQFVVVRHPNGTKTLYAHMSDVIVARGQQIVQGQTIGYVGDTGHSTGPHLHFEVRGTRNPF